MSQPPYGAPPPQPGQPQPYPGQQAPQGYPPQPGYPAAPPQGYPPQPAAGQAPPAYLQGGAPGQAAAPVAGSYGPALPPPPPSQKRSIGFLMGLVTAIALIGFVVLVFLISKAN